MEEKRNVPKLRFPGFTDPWEQRKLGDFGEVAMCKRIYKDQTFENGDVPFFKIGTFGGEPNAFISEELFEDYRVRFSFPKKGTLLISAAGSIGRIVEYQGQKAYFQDSNIVWLEHGSNLDDGFLKQLYSIIKWGLEGSTIKRLYNKDILDAEVVVPDVTEQIQIGTFFRSLDSLIALHQRKLDHVRELKKGLLQKMFPKEGASVPELRFPGFTDPWEQRKLLELAERRNCFSDDPAMPRVEYEDIVSGQGVLNKDVTKKHDARGGIAFESDDVLYGKLRPYLRNWLNPQFEGIALGDFWVLNPTDINSGFLFSLIQTPAFERVANESTGTKMPRADWQNVSNAEFFIPSSEEEQGEIGALFRKLDSLIALHQRELDHIKELKKGLLQQMFV